MRLKSEMHSKTHGIPRLRLKAALRSLLAPLSLLLVILCSAAAQGASNPSPQSSNITTKTVAVNTTTVKVDITIKTPATAPTAEALSTSWEATPACVTQPTLYNSVADARGRRWGRLGSDDSTTATTAAAAAADVSAGPAANASSTCAFKDADGNPVFTWETAPRCLLAPSMFTATADSQGRLWGQQFGTSCAFKAADSDRPVYDFLTAPVCIALPEPVTSEPDAMGRLWGWESGQECAYKNADNSPLVLPGASNNVQPVSPEEMTARGAIPTAASITWRATPACSQSKPSKLTSVMDSRGRLWGWENNASCAFKDANDAPLYDWTTAPRCLGDVSDSSSVDSEGRLWGWEAGASCAFKDLKQRPLRTWGTAIRCPGAPQLATAVPDSLGRLWGWISDNETSCAFKDALGRPLSFNTLETLPVSDLASTTSAAPNTVPSTTTIATGGLVPVAAAPVASTPSTSPSPSASQPQTPLPSPAPAARRAALRSMLPFLRPGRRLAQSTTAPKSTSPLPVETPVQVVNAQALAEAAYQAAAAQQALGLEDPNAAEAAAHNSTATTLLAVSPLGSQTQGAVGSSSSSGGDEALPGSPHRTAAGGLPIPLETDVASSTATAPASSSFSAGGHGGRRALFSTVANTEVTAAASLGMRRGVEEQRAAQQRWEGRRTQGPDAAFVAVRDAGRLGGSTSHGHDNANSHQHTGGRRLLDSASWYPSCKNYPAPKSVAQDGSGRFWGSEGGSCIYRDASGNPAKLWDIVPACSSDVTPANIKSTDSAGRFWGWENSRSCAFKDGSGNPRSVNSGYSSSSNNKDSGSGSSGSASSNDPWVYAPACTADPTSGNSKTDNKGRLWGWENSRSCAFKDSKGASRSITTQAKAAPSSSSSSSGNSDSNSSPTDFPTGDVATAPSCSGTPTMDTSQPDDVGYLWGWQSGRACVFRSSSGKPIYYAALISGDWDAQPGYVPKPSSKSGWFDAPRCSQPPTYDAKPDSEGRLWGYENGQGCVYRDARGYPLFYSDLQNGNVAEYYNKGSLWDNSPACPNAPSWSNARADNFGRLWGWDDKAGSSCAFKDASGQAIYPPKP